jgi:carboxypeptidase T
MKPRFRFAPLVATIGSLLVLLAFQLQGVAQDVERDNLPQGIPGYPCYRTVEEIFDAAEAIVAAYPDLAGWIDIGDSWERQEPGGLEGYDISVLKLTSSAITDADPKPKLVVVSTLHGRDYAPTELAIRFAEFLTGSYGEHPDVTWVLDYNEIHLVLIANPDGRKKAETGLYWRKNANNAYCTGTDYRGADLDRNFPFNWGCCGGSSSDPCSDDYRGPSPASEPETQALVDYLRWVLADARPDDPTAPAPDSTSGLLIDLSSYGGFVYWPWGWTATDAPNGTALQTLGRKLAYLDGYIPSRYLDLYPVDGSLIDFAYGDLGVASYEVVLGTAFFQDCSTFEAVILPQHVAMLLAAGKNTRTPYLTPSGPDAVDLSLGEPESGFVGIAATIDDTRYSDLNGVEPNQTVVAAEYYIDVPPWLTDASPVSIGMNPADGAFDSPVEAVTAMVALASLSKGRHTLFVRGQDAAGNWGAVSAAFLEPDTLPPCTPPEFAARGRLNRVVLSWGACPDPDVDRYVIYRGESSLPTDAVATVAHPGTAYVDRGLERGLYYYRVAAVDGAGNTGQYSEQDSAYVRGLRDWDVRFGPEVTVDGFRLSWLISPEDPAILGCNIYRWKGPGEEPEKLNRVPVRCEDGQWVFTDKCGGGDRTVEYFIGVLGGDGDEIRYGPYSVGCRASKDPLWVSPNPTRGSCLIHFEAQVPGAFEVGVYDLTGRLVRLLEKRTETPGHCSVGWDGLDSEGRPPAPGIYFCRVAGSQGTRTCKVTLLH